MDRHRPDLSRIVPATALAAVGVTLVPVGIWLDTWWTIAIGITAAAAAAWIATDPRGQG